MAAESVAALGFANTVETKEIARTVAELIFVSMVR